LAIDLANDPSCAGFNKTWNTATATQPEGCANNFHDSYMYLGYILDKIGNDGDAIESNTPTLSALGVSLPLTGDVPVQGEKYFAAALAVNAENEAGYLGGGGTIEFYGDQKVSGEAFDEDIDVRTTRTFFGGALPLYFGSEGTDISGFYGNGGTDTIFRLKEGVERFLITDINNPGGASAAQSNIWIMADQISTLPTGFNHIPGGSNVLYLDGHVSFVRYQDGIPCTRSFAEIVAGVQR
jgi:prepilin-type processing-associated H-X9-DG protein